VTGIDNLSEYYDVSLKLARLEVLVGAGHARDLGQSAAERRQWRRRGFAEGEEAPTECRGAWPPTAAPGTFRFEKLDLADRAVTAALFAEHAFERVVHLAAQPGVRYSIDHPHAYADSNIVGFLNVLEGCRHSRVGHLVYASSSSVYGANERLPFSVQDNVDHPVSLYAASKKANELMAHAYAHLYRLPATGLRFFTVYGPWGRPDMAPMKFARAMLAGEPIDVYGHGNHTRDFTYIDDIVEGVLRALDRPAQPDPAWDGRQPNPATSKAPWRLYNIGGHRPIGLMTFIEALEDALGVEARKNFLPMQPGDVPDTCADVQSLIDDIGYHPQTTLAEGVAQFVAWYREYYG
jgi:UDP-glucuronate 4-epimerase